MITIFTWNLYLTWIYACMELPITSRKSDLDYEWLNCFNFCKDQRILIVFQPI